MKKEQLFLILSAIGILFLLILINFQKPVLTGRISSITIVEDRINIKLENYAETIMFYNKTKINLTTSTTIEVYGQEQTSLDSSIIFAEKLVKIK